ncbi:limbic system-associated membrane protein, putative [Ixodes scapularis]|uniref:Limbic system-associated membrane protein, putative n=1 Tax=Ixodes scapularis TaxID=6945 RepID=B7PTR3_IXOSC|nr:limbic system-associated membrane protein, putative [Ixodes scapularis]|eukprot:XP_002404785.1 limbic system-associated membrane protein, putative [Ixodes scapularis]
MHISWLLVEIGICGVHGDDEFIKVWIKNKDILFAGSFRVHPDPRMSLGPDDELKIEGLVSGDDGVYTCKVNSQIEPNSIQHKLVLPGPPKLKTHPESGEVKVMKGEPFEIGCTASGKPDSVITWRHMNDSSINVAALVKNNVIQIDSAELKHSGTYECTAANGYGDPVVGFITVSILGKPTVTTTLQWTAGFAGSLSAELLCVAHSATPSSTRWVRDDGTWLLHGESVHLFTAGNHYTAKFKEVSERDFGNYTCESKNKFGVTMDTVELSNVPTKPYVVPIEAPNTTTYEISLSTVTPFPVTKYVLFIRAEKHADEVDEWRNITLPRHHQQKTGSKHATNYLITNLEPGTKYEAYAAVSNEKGMSRLTDFKFTTASDALQEEIKDDPNAGSSSTQNRALSVHMDLKHKSLQNLECTTDSLNSSQQYCHVCNNCEGGYYVLHSSLFISDPLNYCW